MKIIAPFCNFEELEELIKIGVDEFYAGVLTDDWVEKNTLSFSANKRAKRENSLYSFEELKEAFDLITKNGKDFYFIFNNFYVNSQKKLILDMFEKAKQIGIKNFIVTDLFLIEKISNEGLNPILSITTPIFNKEAAQFYKDLGVKKIILPRDLSLKEIDTITKNVDMEYEVIIFNETCPNVDGLCRFFHGENKENSFVKHACVVNFQMNLKSDLVGEKRIELMNRIKSNLKFTRYSNFCGVCALYQLKNMNITSLKMPSRGHNLNSKVKDINFVKKSISELNSFNGDKLHFKEIMKKEYFKTYNYSCRENCYYN